MKVCIAEKPSVAREIARILGADARKDGYYEGNDYQVTWTFGHLCTLKEPNDYNPALKRWNIFNLPIIPEEHGIKLKTNQGVSKQFQVIKRLVNNCDEVINCGDAGQEGELIQRWVLELAECDRPIKRLWISSLTDEAIKEGFTELRDGREFDRLFAAGRSRAVGDWLLGMNATRLYTLKYSNGGGVLSIGRVQTPTLAMIVERQKEIEHFKPEPFWELKTLYRDTRFSATEGRFTVKEKAEEALKIVTGQPFIITDFTKKEGKESPPRLFDLTSLQVESNKKFAASADETLQAVQNLYERKMVTYPRTDSQYLSNDMYPKIPGILKQMTPYAKFTEPLLAEPIRKSKKVFDDKKVTDHHAIIPTGVFPSGLAPLEKKIYDTIARRFLAAFHPDCLVSNTTVLGEAAEKEFKATGKQILSPGWRILYQSNQSENAGSEEQIMPHFEEGESGEHTPELLEKTTQPPKAHTEASLLRAMETAGKQVDDEELRELMKENGIGRPSTRAAIIETLFRRKYIVKKRKNLIATQTGVQLIETIQNNMLKSAELTGQWERKLRDIEKGDYEPDAFLKEMNDMVWHIVEDVLKRPAAKITIVDEKTALKNATAKAKPAKAIKPTTCPKCSQGQILRGKTAFGCSRWKEGCDFKVMFELMGKKLTDKQLLALIGKGKSPKIKGIEMAGKKIEGVFVLNDEHIPVFEEVVPDKLVCPKCKEGELLKGKSAYGCSRWKEGCRFVVPFEMHGKKLTQAQLKQLVKKGKTNKIKGFVYQDGNKGEGILVVNAEGIVTLQQP